MRALSSRRRRDGRHRLWGTAFPKLCVAAASGKHSRSREDIAVGAATDAEELDRAPGNVHVAPAGAVEMQHDPGSCTVTCAVPTPPAQAAVIATLPSRTPVTWPSSLTVAIVGSPLLQVTGGSTRGRSQRA